MKQFKFGKETIEFSDDFDFYRQYYDVFLMAGTVNSNMIADAIKTREIKVGAEDFINGISEMGNEMIRMMSEAAVSCLIEQGIYDYDVDRFINDPETLCFERSPAYREFIEELGKINSKQNEYDAELIERKDAAYHSWQGGGFGVKGAVKGAFGAGMLNIATGTLTGIGRAIDKKYYDSLIKDEKNALLNSDLTVSLSEVFYNIAAEEIPERLFSIIHENLGKDPSLFLKKNSSKTRAMYNNIDKVPQEKRQALLAQVIEQDPVCIDYLTYVLDNYDSLNIPYLEAKKIVTYISPTIFRFYNISKATALAKELDAELYNCAHNTIDKQALQSLKKKQSVFFDFLIDEKFLRKTKGTISTIDIETVSDDVYAYHEIVSEGTIPELQKSFLVELAASDFAISCLKAGIDNSNYMQIDSTTAGSLLNNGETIIQKYSLSNIENDNTLINNRAYADLKEGLAKLSALKSKMDKVDGAYKQLTKETTGSNLKQNIIDTFTKHPIDGFHVYPDQEIKQWMIDNNELLEDDDAVLVVGNPYSISLICLTNDCIIARDRSYSEVTRIAYKEITHIEQELLLPDRVQITYWRKGAEFGSRYSIPTQDVRTANLIINNLCEALGVELHIKDSFEKFSEWDFENKPSYWEENLSQIENYYNRLYDKAVEWGVFEHNDGSDFNNAVLLPLSDEQRHAWKHIMLRLSFFSLKKFFNGKITNAVNAKDYNDAVHNRSVIAAALYRHGLLLKNDDGLELNPEFNEYYENEGNPWMVLKWIWENSDEVIDFQTKISKAGAFKKAILESMGPSLTYLPKDYRDC